MDKMTNCTHCDFSKGTKKISFQPIVWTALQKEQLRRAIEWLWKKRWQQVKKPKPVDDTPIKPEEVPTPGRNPKCDGCGVEILSHNGLCILVRVRVCAMPVLDRLM